MIKMVEALVAAVVGMFGTYTILDIVNKAKKKHK